MTTNMTSQEQLMKAAVQSQLARIMKEEEEEELWISGEELYTEGSSDEEECTTQSTMRRKTNSNQSSHVTSSAETKTKTTCSIGISKSNSAEGQTPKLPKTQTNTQTTNSSAEWDELDDTKISWKTKRDIDDTMLALKELRSLKELAELDTGSLQASFTEESFDNYSENDTDFSDKRTYATDDESMVNEILEVKNLDNLIRRMNGRVKKAREETSICQRENRERLRNILSAAGGPAENGKLAQNTQLFLRLCPTYVTLSAETNTKELCLKYEKNDSTTAKAESHTDNVLNISHEENDFKLQTLRNDGTTSASYPRDSSCNLEWLNEKWEMASTSTSSDVEKLMADALDFDRNPYAVDEKTRNILLEAEKKLSVYQKDFRNDSGRFLGAPDSISDSTVISTISSVPTMQSLRDVDKDLLAEVIKEAGIINPSSI